MFRNQITSKLCMSDRFNFGYHVSARECFERNGARVILDAPDPEVLGGEVPVGRRPSELSWLPVTELVALTCLYLLIANPFG
ncbi:hypothetical protein ROA7450_03709 [Roseovarius albus]|uniref:Uncharacterized protein n=1 Tax=Roseovarius albus TaxID=1247867 RepID=A0A1X7A350_9RHOB|nr:hypothetical protein [Roseovarius albus]SLN68851.1 hypothetical protein ROA7450_03709 [Roseovarius albus]